ncbi:MAG: hypothetical protein ACK5KL_08585 [Dysgonomonas sp.]
MEIVRFTQINKEEVLNIDFHLFIATSGYEKRSISLSEQGVIKSKTKIVFGFEENQNNKIRKQNDKYYKNSNFKYVITSGNTEEAIVEQIKNYIENECNESYLRIAIDYSSMTRIWYASIIDFFNNYSFKKKIALYFLYSKAQFTPPPKTENQNFFFEPIKGFSNLSIPNKPTALILGLGYEKRRAFSLKEYFDAEEVYVFLTDENSAPEFHKEVCSRNKELISKLHSGYIFKYPLNDLSYTRKLLFDLCNQLLIDYRIVIAPCGPKPFTLISLVVASMLPNIDVWRISGNKGYDRVDRSPTGDILSLLIEYEDI